MSSLFFAEPDLLVATWSCLASAILSSLEKVTSSVAAPHVCESRISNKEDFIIASRFNDTDKDRFDLIGSLRTPRVVQQFGE